jgi:NarL family two-component system response regulator LiaR
MNEAITLVLVDDHAIVRQGVRAFLETQPDMQVVGEAATGEEGAAVCGALAPDVCLMDLLMPGGGGVEGTRWVKAASPRTQVLVLTSYHDDEYVLPAIRAGALSYVLKDIGPEELVTAVRRASRGEATLSPAVAGKLMAALQSERRITAPAQSRDPLTAREHEVLRLIAEGIGNAEIAARLFVSEKTIKSHVSNILAKLHLADRTQAAVYAWRQGLV